MELYSETVQNEQGDIVNGATITVYIASSGAVATLYDKDGVSQANPFLSGLNRSKGEIEFAAVNGLYNIKVVNGASTVWHYNQALFDATSAESPIWSGNGIYNGLCLVNQKSVVLDAAAVSATNSEYPIDQHKTTLSGVAGTHQWLSTSQPTGLTGYSLKYAATSTASGQIGSRQIIERYADYASKTVTYSRWVKSNSTNARLVIDDGTTKTTSAHTGGGAWELLTVSVAAGASPSALTCYAVIASATLTNVSITSGDYIEFTDARLDLGSHRLSGDREYGEELVLCQRYYWRQQRNVDADSIIISAILTSTTAVRGVIRFPVTMRAPPTVAVLNNLSFLADGTGYVSTGFSSDSGLKTASIILTTSGKTAGDAALISFTTTGDYIDFSSEL